MAALIFSSQEGTKNRPVLVVYDAGDDDLLVAPVTSHAGRSERDISLDRWKEAGLRLPSTVRLEKLATIEKGRVVQQLGEVTGSDRLRLKSVLELFLKTISKVW